MSSTSRTRTRGGYTNSSAILRIWDSSSGASINDVTYAKNGTLGIMSDVVTKPFVPGKAIVNSAMNSVVTTYANTPMAGGQSHTNTTGFNRAEGEVYLDRESDLAPVLSRISINYAGLLTQAATSALAGVRRPEVSGLVSLAEIRSTAQTLLNPVNGALKWLSRNAKPSKKKQTRKQRKAELRNTLRDVSDQHLSIIFGLMPFISDIQGILKALEAIKPVPVRMTSRGNASAYDAKSEAVRSGSTSVYQDYANSAQVAYTVRAYVLYEAGVSLQNALGLGLSDVPKSVWQATTLSFVVDWFANVGDYISAMTPQVEINYLASGYTITNVETISSSYSLTRVNAGGWTGSYSGGSFSRVKVMKSRVPDSLFHLTGITLKSDMHRDVLDTFKITAGLSLITQKLSKFL